MDLERGHELVSDVLSAIASATPDDACGATLGVRLAAEGGRTRVSHELRAAAGDALPAPPEVLAAMREHVTWSRGSPERYRAANYALYAEDGAWKGAAAFGRRGSGWSGNAPMREGDRWPATVGELLEQHLVLAVCRQRRLEREVGTSRWNADLDDLKIRFPQAGREFPVQLLGSAGETTWRWGWANLAGFEERTYAASLRLREFGNAAAAVELLAPELPLGPSEGHGYASIAAGILGYDAYYRCPHGAGSAWLLLTAPELSEPTEPDGLELAAAIAQAVAIGVVRHRPAVEWAARGLALPLTELPDGSLRIELRPDGELVAAFDALGRMTGLRSSLRGGPPDAAGATS